MNLGLTCVSVHGAASIAVRRVVGGDDEGISIAQ